MIRVGYTASLVPTTARRGEALSRLLPMQISLNSLQAKARRYVSVLEEVLESDDDLESFQVAESGRQAERSC